MRSPGTLRHCRAHCVLFQRRSDLARTYLQYAKNYLEQYEKLLAPYPYKRFAIVENFLSTGYSMQPSPCWGRMWCGSRSSSNLAGHEILHQWFGNSVYVDDDRGNWCEGLTTYLADTATKSRKAKGGVP